MADDIPRRPFVYEGWANREVLKAIRAAGNGDKRSLQLMAHILAAGRVWLERLRQIPQSVPVWPQSGLAGCEVEAKQLESQWLEYLKSAVELSQAVTYKNTKGESWSSSIGDVLTHVLMHSAYHRGQIASHMREQGHTPAYTDFIHAVRQGHVA